MRKGLTISLIICIILMVLSQLVLPTIGSRTVDKELREALETENVSTSISTFPGFMLLFGKIDSMHVEAENGKLGNIRCSKLVLDGQNIDADLSALSLNDGSAIRSADSITLAGTITEANLQEFLQNKLDKVEDLKVKMTKESITATGNIKILKRNVELSLTGQLFEDNGMIYFHMTHLDIKGGILGKAVVGNFFGDIMILNLRGIAFPSEFEGVEHYDGYVILKARSVQKVL